MSERRQPVTLLIDSELWSIVENAECDWDPLDLLCNMFEDCVKSVSNAVVDDMMNKAKRETNQAAKTNTEPAE